MKFVIGKDVLNHEYKGFVYDNDTAGRLNILRKLFLVAFVIFALRTFQLALQQSEYVHYGFNNAEIERRADIVDRNGIVLAKSIRAGNIKLFPKKVKAKDKNNVAKFISELSPMDFNFQDAFALIESGKAGVYIKMHANEDQIKSARLANRKYDCLEIEEFTVRKYPQKNIFAHVVGFAGKDEGLAGIEYTYDKYLKENNDPLRLSIDSRIQNIFHEQLSIAMNKYHAKGAMGMLMKSSTGEVIAMVQLPDYDPNHIGANQAGIRRSKIMRDNFEMGSVFKIFNTALAFENGLENNIYDVSKPFPIKDKYNRTVYSIKDLDSFYRDVVKKAGKGKMKAPEIMLHSCNTGSAQIALDLPDGVQKAFFHKLHFDKALQLDFGKTETAITYKNWGPTERATASFGHGIAITPMHLLLAVNAMTNGGFYIYPTLLKRGVGAIQGERVLDSSISGKIREIMYRIAEETTARRARVSGIKIGGKTGTAEKRNRDGTADKSRNTTVFAGIFPVDAPQYVILIMLDEPQGTKETWNWKTAAWNSVPTAGIILDRIIPLLFE